jgi:hypothetical protein
MYAVERRVILPPYNHFWRVAFSCAVHRQCVSETKNFSYPEHLFSRLRLISLIFVAVSFCDPQSKF